MAGKKITADSAKERTVFSPSFAPFCGIRGVNDPSTGSPSC